MKVAGTAVGSALAMKGIGQVHAADIPPTHGSVSAPALKIKDYSSIPQRMHVYPASDRAKKTVQNAIPMDSLLSGVWPSQWSSAEAPELHAEMDHCQAAGFKVLACFPSADSMDSSIKGVGQAQMFYLNKLSEQPGKYKIVRNAQDIDVAIKEKKLGWLFTHQGTALFGGEVDMVGLWKQLGYGHCLLAYNQRNAVGDGCFERDNGGLTAFGN